MTTEASVSGMPKWRSHKIVEAASITSIDRLEEGVVTVMVPSEDPGAPFMLLDMQVPDGLAARGKPALGDFLVAYDDGYISWSPQKVFREGYTPIE